MPTALLSCPPTGHEFTTPPTPGPFTVLCACERALLTGSTRAGVTTSRVEVLDG